VIGRSYKLVGLVAAFLTFVCLPALANSNDNFSNVQLQGVSGTVSGSFTFNPSTDAFSNISLSFNGGVFGGVQANDSQAQGYCSQGLCQISWWTIVHGDFVTDTIVFNTKTGQFQDYGGVSNWQNQGKFNYLSVPEGGAKLSYLTLSGLVIFAGILKSGKQRRATRTVQSI